jgi:broad specificity phosphatase PhoE
MTTRMILIRHGETAHNKSGVTLGRADVPLNERGRLQARALAASFDTPPDAIYSSPLSRASDTAHAIASATGTPVEITTELIEMDVGEMEHLAYDDLRAKYGDFLREWMSAPAKARMPGGETLSEVQERAWSWIERTSSAHSDGTVVAVAHNFVILTITCRAMGLPLDDFRRLKTSVGGKTTIEFGERGRSLVHWNDTSHLRARGLA